MNGPQNIGAMGPLTRFRPHAGQPRNPVLHAVFLSLDLSLLSNTKENFRPHPHIHRLVMKFSFASSSPYDYQKWNQADIGFRFSMSIFPLFWSGYLFPSFPSLPLSRKGRSAKGTTHSGLGGNCHDALTILTNSWHYV